MVTIANDLAVVVVLVTRCSEMATAAGAFRTQTWATLTTGCYTKHWVTIVTIGTSVTLVSVRVVPAVDAGSRPLVALVSMAVTLTRSAVGETPVTRLASVTLLTKGSRPAPALTRQRITQPSHRTLHAATAGDAA